MSELDVWLWDTEEGPGGRACGVADSLKAARRSACISLAEVSAAEVIVEEARIVFGGRGIQTAYERRGTGWKGRCRNGRVRWTRFRHAFPGAA